MAKETDQTAYTEGIKYLFKTGFDSYVSGEIKFVFTDEITLKDARLQIPPNKIDGFMERAEPMQDHPVHTEMILHRINIDWAVPVR